MSDNLIFWQSINTGFLDQEEDIHYLFAENDFRWTGLHVSAQNHE